MGETPMTPLRSSPRRGLAQDGKTLVDFFLKEDSVDEGFSAGPVPFRFCAGAEEEPDHRWRHLHDLRSYSGSERFIVLNVEG